MLSSLGIAATCSFFLWLAYAYVAVGPIYTCRYLRRFSFSTSSFGLSSSFLPVFGGLLQMPQPKLDLVWWEETFVSKILDICLKKKLHFCGSLEEFGLEAVIVQLCLATTEPNIVISQSNAPGWPWGCRIPGTRAAKKMRMPPPPPPPGLQCSQMTY